jgi:flagellar basal-body rod protein FlgG
MTALDTAATGMLAQQLNVEVIANNIANLNTTGFKRQRAEFQDLLYQNLEQIGTDTSNTGTIEPTGVQIGTGVEAAAVYRITEQGGITITDNSLDLAIDGRGYFTVEMPTGESAYTRAGAFQLSPDGDIVTSEGFIVGPGVTIPPDAKAITISSTGIVSVTIDGQVNPTQVGQLDITTFPNDAGLEAIGGNMYLESASSGTPTTGAAGDFGFGFILQGALENSNVNVVQEITALITAQRAYEMNSQVIQAADEMAQTATNL